MRARTLILFLVAIMLAGGTAMLVRSWLAQQRTVEAEAAPMPPPPPQKSVLVAHSAIPRGQILKPTDLTWQMWPDGDIDHAYIQKGAKTFDEKLKADPAVYGQVIVTTLQPPAETDIAPAGTADMVLTFRNVHDWLPRGTTQDYFKAFYRALKPGGILGITDHRADPTQPQDPNAKNGYVRQDYMIQLAEQAGFKLAGTSEINANPKDLRDHPVWNLPPTLREGEKDRAKYLAIGESDRMTLKFTKPVTDAQPH